MNKRSLFLLKIIMICICLRPSQSDAADINQVKEALDRYEASNEYNVPVDGATENYNDEIPQADPVLTQNQVIGYTNVLTSEPVIVVEQIKNENPSPVQANPLKEFPDDMVIDALELKNMDIVDVLKLIADKSSLNIVAGDGVVGKVTIYLSNVKLKDAMRIILDSNGLAYKLEDGIVRVMTAKEFETRYGYIFGGNIQTKMVQLAYANVNDLVPVLNQIKSSSGKVIFDMKSNTMVLMDSPEAISMMEQYIIQIDSPDQTEVFQLSYAKVKDIEDKVKETLTLNTGKLKSDERSNRFVVTDTKQKIEEVRNVIRAFDQKEKQVLIEAKIVQIILSEQQKFGIDWQAMVRDYHDLELTSHFNILQDNSKRGELSIGTIESDDYEILLHALKTVGTTNILSSPSITALNNQEAKILVGSTEPYVTTTTTVPSSGPSTTAESVNFIEVGVKLYVTPVIHEDNFITMKIKPEVSSVTRTLTTGNNNLIPVVETSEAETRVTVKDNVTIVIGGLIKDEKIDSTNKIPLLGSIPLVGRAFRNDDTFNRKTEIVIFLTPKISTGDVAMDNGI